MAGVDVAAFEPLCTFKSMSRKSGEEIDQARWKGHAPAVVGMFGQGKVAVFGPHPDAGGSNKFASDLFARCFHWVTPPFQALDEFSDDASH